MIAGFSGASTGMNLLQCLELYDEMKEWDVHKFHLGDCIGGDHQAWTIAKHMGNIELIGHPPNNPNKRAFLKYDFVHPDFPYLDRNHNIVDFVNASRGIMFIGPKTFKEELRSGTWATFRYAKKVDCHIHILQSGLVKPNAEKSPWNKRG